MTNAEFVLTVGIGLTVLLGWAFKHLPQEQWQMMATLPRTKQHSGRWEGVNLTYYGVITASAAAVAIVIFLMLMASVHVRLSRALTVVVGIIACCLPASRLVARVIERKPHTSTVAGAVFVGQLIAPLALLAVNGCMATDGVLSPLGPTMAAIAVAYVFGEGLGRLACISFGCCYGKPIAAVRPGVRRLFERFHFAFEGDTKKIAYESGLQGTKVVPIQALTSTLYTAVGLVSMFLFLESSYGTAYALAMLFSQGWRIYSETLRADHRGGGKISVYQKMTVVGMAYAAALSLVFPAAAVRANLAAGLAALWDPLVIITLQILWAVIFAATGWSMVTGSRLSFYVESDALSLLNGADVG